MGFFMQNSALQRSIGKKLYEVSVYISFYNFNRFIIMILMMGSQHTNITGAEAGLSNP